MVQMLALFFYAMLLLLQQAWEARPIPVPVVDLATGNDSLAETGRVMLAIDSKTWNDAWIVHRFTPPVGNSDGLAIKSLDVPPRVDFSRYEILAIFGGVTKGVGGYTVDSSFQQGETVKVRVRPVPLPGATGTSLNLFANPYAFIEFPKLDKPIELQFPDHDKSGAEIWKTVAKLGVKAKPLKDADH